MTYGDGLSNIDIHELTSFHQSHCKIGTISAVLPAARFGALDISPTGSVKSFIEKPKGDNAWINGGFFVFKKEIIEYIDDDNSIFEETPLKKLSADGELLARKHDGFWMPMDTLRDKRQMEGLLASGNAPWAVW